jgi:GNAT superfamily N-acetyltransferase
MIRRARTDEHHILTSLSFYSKRYWQYPESYYQIWKNELTITPGYIRIHEVYVYEKQQQILAYYSLVRLTETLVTSGVRLDAGVWLEHMFVLPENIGHGIGRALFHHCRDLLAARDIHCLKILADPHARGFYEKMGCRIIDEYPSTIEGRTTPYLHYTRESSGE